MRVGRPGPARRRGGGRCVVVLTVMGRGLWEERGRGLPWPCRVLHAFVFASAAPHPRNRYISSGRKAGRRRFAPAGFFFGNSCGGDGWIASST